MTDQHRPQDLELWLSNNVQHLAEPKSISLSRFQIEESGFAGSFELCLDSNRIIERFSFGLAQNGKPELFVPMHISPLGVPASFAAVELTSGTRRAICDLLAATLPKMKPLGLDKRTGELVLHTTHRDFDRIKDPESYHKTMALVGSAGFEVSRRLDDAQPIVAADT